MKVKGPKPIPGTLLFVALIIAVGGLLRLAALGQQNDSTTPYKQSAPRRWTPKAEPLSPALVDGDMKSYALLGKPTAKSPIDYGLEWTTPVRLNRVVIKYASLEGRVYQPAPDRQELQYWDGSEWVRITNNLTIDYTKESAFAEYERSGYVNWTYRFNPVSTTRIRVLATGVEQNGNWDAWCAARDIRAFYRKGSQPISAPGHTNQAVRVVGSKPGAQKVVDEARVNLVSNRFGARISTRQDASVEWPRPRMIDRVIVSLPHAVAANGQNPPTNGPHSNTDQSGIEWWDGEKWQPVERVKFFRMSFQLEFEFEPLAVTGIRVHVQGARKIEAYLDDRAPTYFQGVYDSPQDEFMQRILAHSGDPSFGRVANLMLPLDFEKTVMGRVDDDAATTVLWNGTIVTTTPTHQKEPRIDQWYALASGENGELFGANPPATSEEYIKGCLPGVITAYRNGNFDYTERAFDTSPDDFAQGTAIELEVKNRGSQAANTAIAVILGRRMTARDARRHVHGGSPPNPLNFDPVLTGYSYQKTARVVRNQAGEIVLYGDRAGEWQGTPWERVLRFPVTVNAGATVRIHLFVPHITKPETNAARVARLNFKNSLAKFIAYWDTELTQGRMVLHLPESKLNRMYKSLLAQSLIILKRHNDLLYGSYWYEAYFGLEEGWPAVALAQYGFTRQAEADAEIMLNPANMDKSNYYHQFRNGLDPWYALRVYYLSGDRAWLDRITPRLTESADWTVRVRHETAGRDDWSRGLLPRDVYGGDISTRAYSLWSNACCWRGLEETGRALQSAGENQLAEKYLRDAADFRSTLWKLYSKITDRNTTPPFVPLAIEIGHPGSAAYHKVEKSYPFLAKDPLGNYWILLSPDFLETGLFSPTDERARWVTGYLEEKGGLVAGLARFYGGTDYIYGFGYALALLKRQERRKYLATFYSMVAHGMSRNTFSSPEVAGVFPLRVSNLQMEAAYRNNLWRWAAYGLRDGHPKHGDDYGSEPLSAGPGVMLQLLRRMLVYEPKDSDGKPTGQLALANLIPESWLKDGRRLEVADAPTYFGKVSFSVDSHLKQGYIEARIDPPKRAVETQIVLHLPSPNGGAIRQVKLNGRLWNEFHKDEISLPGNEGRLSVTAYY
jgi:hypothetical protein